MKISQIDVFQLDIPLEKPKRYPNRTYASLDDTIVRLVTDSGLVGWGEVCPIASTYQPEHALGVRAAIEEMAPGLIGEDPTQTDRINATMSRWLMGGEYAKSAIDIACWDIVGKAYDRPVYHLIGGRMQAKARAYPEIEMGPPEVVERRIAQYREEGFRHFQVKAGRGSEFDLDIARIRKAGECVRPGETLVVDANKAWKTHEALRILRLTEDGRLLHRAALPDLCRVPLHPPPGAPAHDPRRVHDGHRGAAAGARRRLLRGHRLQESPASAASRACASFATSARRPASS